MKQKRKMKRKDVRDAVNLEKQSNKSNRDKLLKEHGNTNDPPLLRKQTTIVGVFNEDITNKTFKSQAMTGSNSDIYGPDGKKISYSYDGENDRSLLYDFKERNPN